MTYSCICDRKFPSTDKELYMHMFECCTQQVSELRTRYHQEKQKYMLQYVEELDDLIQQTKQTHASIQSTYNDAIALKQQVPELETNVLVIENKRLTNLYNIVSGLETDKALHQYKTKLDTIVLDYNTQLQAQQVEFQKKEQHYIKTQESLQSDNAQLRTQIKSINARLVSLEDEKTKHEHHVRTLQLDFEHQLHVKQLDISKLSAKQTSLETAIHEQKTALQTLERHKRDIVLAHEKEHASTIDRYEHTLTCLRQDYDKLQTQFRVEQDNLIREKNKLVDEYEHKIKALERELYDATQTIEMLTEKAHDSTKRIHALSNELREAKQSAPVKTRQTRQTRVRNQNVT